MTLLQPMLSAVLTKSAVRLLLLNVTIALCCLACLGQTAPPPAEIKFKELHFRKPPLVEMVFDVTLRNSQPEPRWFLLPTNIHPKKKWTPTEGGVDALEVFAPQGTGRVFLARFLGTGGFQSLLLPAHSEIRLRQLPISYWGDPPNDLRIPILVVRDFKIGNAPSETWFTADPTCSTSADISEMITGRTSMLSSHHTPDGKEVPTAIDEERRFELNVSINKERPSGTP